MANSCTATAMDSEKPTNYPGSAIPGDGDELQANITSPLIIIQSAWYSFVFMIGVIGNLYVVLTVLCRRGKSSTTNIFIVNLALSDLGVVLITIPQEYIREHFSWPFDKLECQIFVPLNEVFSCVSICTLTVITLERYRVICKPLKASVNEKEAKIIIVIVWLASYLSVGFPVSFFMDTTKDINGFIKCLPRWPSDLHRRLHVCFIVALMVIPLSIIAAGYTAIVRSMNKHSARIRQRAFAICSNNDSFRQDMFRLKQNAKLIRMLLLIVTVFWICMLPVTLLALTIEFGGINTESRAVQGLYTFSVALFLTNSAFNPVALYILSSELRNGIYSFRRYVLKRCF